MSMFVEGKHQILFEKPRKKKELDRFPFRAIIPRPPPGGLIFPVGAPCPTPYLKLVPQLLAFYYYYLVIYVLTPFLMGMRVFS